MEEERERLARYIDAMERVLAELEIVDEKPAIRRIVENARAYVEDAKHYLNQGDYSTGLVCIAYAEGLLDALRELGHIRYEWKRAPTPRLQRVLVAGTFDLLHPGHLYLLREAWKMGRVVVIVARDRNVVRFKGREPIIPEAQRLEMIRGIRWVDEAMLGDPDDPIRGILRAKPDVILLGPDQAVDEEELRRKLEQHGLAHVKIIRLRERYRGHPLTSTSAIIRRVLELFGSRRQHLDLD